MRPCMKRKTLTVCLLLLGLCLQIWSHADFPTGYPETMLDGKVSHPFQGVSLFPDNSIANTESTPEVDFCGEQLKEPTDSQTKFTTLKDPTIQDNHGYDIIKLFTKYLH